MLRDYEIKLLAEDIANLIDHQDLESLGIAGKKETAVEAITNALNKGDISTFKKYFRDSFTVKPGQTGKISSIVNRLNQHAGIYVAIESTSDYSDGSFRAERMNTAGGLMVRDKYRIVCMDGTENLVPINDRIFKTGADAAEYIYDHPQYVLVSYDELIEMIPTESLSFPEAYGLDNLKGQHGGMRF